MEAMARARPVVASQLSGIPELVDNMKSGLLFEPGNAQEAANAIEILANNLDLRHSMGLAGRQRVEDDYNLSVNAALLATRIRQHIGQPTG
jgi:glycosyltransferase involved in cell wall biosynthesis